MPKHRSSSRPVSIKGRRLQIQALPPRRPPFWSLLCSEDVPMRENSHLRVKVANRLELNLLGRQQEVVREDLRF